MKMKKKKFCKPVSLIDYDDVLVNLAGYSVERVNRECGTSFTVYDITGWGLLGNELDKRMEHFIDPDFMGSIPVFDGAVQFIEDLQKVSEVFIATSVKHQCATARFNHIIENFPMIPISNIIIGDRKDMIRGDFHLDDGYHNLKNSMVTYPVMMQRPWNYSNTGVLSVNGYDEFLNLFEIVRNSFEKDFSKIDAVVLVGATGSGKKKLANSLVDTGKFERVKTYSTKRDSTSYHVLPHNEFVKKKESGIFLETSVYMNDFYGMMRQDIDNVIAKGKIPLMILDINGAMAVQSCYNVLNVFVEADKDKCIRSILNKDLSNDEKTRRIISLDRELLNDELCDICVGEDGINDILSVLNERKSA